MKSVRDMNPTSVGLVSVALIMAVVAATYAVGSLGLLEDRYVMSGAFEDAAGLETGADVKVAGIDVGKVLSVEPDRESGQVIATWEVDSNVDLGPETTAEISLATLLGGEYLRLDGPVEEPFLADLAEDERRIPLDRTSVPFPVNETLGDATKLIDAIDADAVNDLVTEFGDLAEGARQPVGEILDGIEQVATVLASREEQLSSLLDESERLTATLADKDDDLVAIIDASETLLAQIVERRDELAAVLGDGSQVVQTLTNLIEDRRADLDAILYDLEIALAAIDRQAEATEIALPWAGPSAEGATLPLSHGPFADVAVTSFGPNFVSILSQLYPDLDLGLDLDLPGQTP